MLAVRAEHWVGRAILWISGGVAWSFWGWKGVVLACCAGIGGRAAGAQ
jgi:hypothetical protein